MLAEKDFLPKNLNFKKSKITTLEAVGLNPLLIVGLTLLKLKVKKMFVAFFEGNPHEERGLVVMEETDECQNLKTKRAKNFFNN